MKSCRPISPRIPTLLLEVSTRVGKFTSSITNVKNKQHISEACDLRMKEEVTHVPASCSKLNEKVGALRYHAVLRRKPVRATDRGSDNHCCTKNMSTVVLHLLYVLLLHRFFTYTVFRIYCCRALQVDVHSAT